MFGSKFLLHERDGFLSSLDLAQCVFQEIVHGYIVILDFRF